MNKQSEFIGAKAEVKKLGIIGTVTDETKNTITITQDGKKKIIIKQNHTFEINGTTINGKDINKRPEDRLKQ